MQPLVQWVIISGVRSVANFLVTTLVDELNDVEYGAGASLREVLSLAGNNAEADTITFADSLAGGVISLIGINITHGDGDGLTVLNGDLDGDGVADITIMGDPNTTGFERNLLTNNGELSITGVDFVGGYGPNGGSTIQNNGDLTVANATISGGISRTMYEVGGNRFSSRQLPLLLQMATYGLAMCCSTTMTHRGLARSDMHRRRRFMSEAATRI